MTEQRPEPRLTIEIPVRVFGMDAGGRPFTQDANATDLSRTGARLTGLEHELRVGDTIGLVFENRKARLQVMWTIDAGSARKMKSGVKLVEGQFCPWESLMNASPPAVAREGERRAWKRYTAVLQVEIRVPNLSVPVRGKTSDVSAIGCYVPTMQPLPRGTSIEIDLWLDQEKISSAAVVRTCDSGVGMGLEFVCLADGIKARIDDYLRNRGS